MARTSQNRAKPCTSSAPATKSKAINPFLIYQHELRQDLKERGVNFTTTKIACMAGERWRQMSSSDKLSYYVWAHKNKQQASKLKIGSKARKSKRKSLVPSYIN